MIRDSINPIEFKMSALVEQHFPNYDLLWENHLVSGIGPDRHWVPGAFEKLGIANYGILKSLNFVRVNYDRITVNDENQTFKNIYYHFGIICELIPYCCRYTYEFCDHFDMGLKTVRFNSEEITNKEIKQVINVFIPDEDEFQNLWKFYDEITKYRHYFTHNPGIDILNINFTMKVISRKHLDKCRKLSTLREVNSTNPEYYINPITQVLSHL